MCRRPNHPAQSAVVNISSGVASDGCSDESGVVESGESGLSKQRWA